MQPSDCDELDDGFERVTETEAAAIREPTWAQVILRAFVEERGVDELCRRTGLSRRCTLELRQGTSRNPRISTVGVCERVGVRYEDWRTPANEKRKA